ncbi:MAG: DNA mismatch repair endonuclease MutL [Alloprevotella sp.]|nr:DNA mismatch repair endonuclease MutL [Alloprevotella sp.]
MPDIIHLLPDAVANQIAAGEVIQRPSSVVKELVENAIDAEATLVQIYITEAGRQCIQVTDDGKGMSPTDARLAFERHATSKIRQATDLFALSTMGFRGEALPSIAAVAQVELRTRLRGQEMGTALTIEGGRFKSQQAAACPVGANFAVRNLFYNIPARRRFLKSNQTEFANILSEFERIALAHPSVSFRLYNNETLTLDLPAASFRRRIAGIFGKRIESSLIPVSVKTELVTITGFVGTPESARRKGAHQYFFVNERFMRHPYFARAIGSAFERFIPEGTQPNFFLRIEVAPERIDVNIHPTKTEIKFQDEQVLWPIFQSAVREALGSVNAVPALDFDSGVSPDIPAYNPSAQPAAPPRLHLDPTYNPFQQTSGNRTLSPAEREAWQSAYAAAFEGLNNPTQPDEPKLWADDMPDATPATTETPLQLKGNETYLQLAGRYIVTVAEEGLMLIDQHRAHVRILYERYRRQLTSGHGVRQGLLFPQDLQLSPSQTEALHQLLPQLSAVGFDLHPADSGYTLNALPAGTEGLDPLKLIEEVVDEVLADNNPDSQAAERTAHLIARTLARKAAIPVGVELSQEEMAATATQLFSSETPTFTPDGEPVLTILAPGQLERLLS